MSSTQGGGPTPDGAVPVGLVVGSLSARSINRRLAELVVGRAPAGTAVAEIPIGGLPLYDYDLDVDPPPEAAVLKDRIASCDAVLFVTPEYNRSLPAALKNALDWGSRPWGENSWSGRRAAVLGTALGGAGTAAAQVHLRGVLGYLGMTVVGAPEVCLRWTDEVLDDPRTHLLVDAVWDTLLADRPAAVLADARARAHHR